MNHTIRYAFRHAIILLAPLFLLHMPTVPCFAEDSSEARYIRMSDNFFIFYDPSTTMDVPYKETGHTRIEAQKEVIEKSNASLPELNWQAGLYPHWKGGLWLHGTPEGFKPFYRLNLYKKTKFAEAISRLPVIPQSPPMLQTGLMKLESLLGLPGKTEVFLFSDGRDSTFEGIEPEPLAQAKKLNELYDVCFTIVSSAQGQKEKQLLEDIAALNSCSQVIDFDTVYEHPEHLLGKLYMDTGSFSNILFDFDKSAIRPEHTAQLAELAAFLAQHPQTYVVLAGFTDSIGTETYNIGLSERRAKSVQNYLHNKHKIDRNRILLYWYGFADPVASNETPEGRQLNRRVTITIRKN